MAHHVDVSGPDRGRSPVHSSYLPDRTSDLPPWAERLISAGYHEALAVVLFPPDGCEIGVVAPSSGSRQEAPPLMRRRLPALGRAVGPMASLVAAARMVQGATAGVVLYEGGATAALPGLTDHPLLHAGSPAMTAARSALASGLVHTAFLWPQAGDRALHGHTRITALTSPEDVPEVITGMVLVSPAGDLRGLTPRELQVLGLVIDGRSNHQIAAALVVAQRTVAAHLEHILVKLAAPTRTLAAVRAERAGLYVPAPT
jgi:DNA-binding CsgD family transcriptional regulator